MRALTTKLSSGSDLAAVNKGREALLFGRYSDASAWLDRACRLAPRSAAVKLLLASSLAGNDDARAASQLADIVSAHPAAWLAMRLLAQQACRLGEGSRAADLVSHLLAHSAMPQDAPFRELASNLASISGKPGWTGLSHDGVLLFSVLADFRLDGEDFRPQIITPQGELLRARLPKRWRQARELEVTRRGRHLLGSPVDIGALNFVQGFVDFGSRAEAKRSMSVKGWAWMPGCPDVQPTLQILAGNRRTVLAKVVADDGSFSPSNNDGVARPRGFNVDVAGIQEEKSIYVVDRLGRDVFGSPLNIEAHREFSRPAAPRNALQARTAGAATLTAGRASSFDILRRPEQAVSRALSAVAGRTVEPVPVDIVIPVFVGADDFRACITSIKRSGAEHYRLIVVDDASPDQALQNAMSDAAEDGAIILRQKSNRGFPAAANAGLRHAIEGSGEARDVVLLNPDTLVTPGWLDRLRSAAYSNDDIGSATPMTNDGSIVSYPSAGQAHCVAGQAQADALALVFGETNPGVAVEIPTAVGFCMYVRRDCLMATGLFREDVFAQGYAEENDWSMRARQLGWRHIVDGATFVCHTGGRSFGGARQDLLARNLVTLNHLHPDYNKIVHDFVAADPLKAIRRNADTQRWRQTTSRSGSVILITHTLGGGVERHVRARGQEVRRQGLRPIVLRPPKEAIGTDHYSTLCHVAEEDADGFPNLLFPWKTDAAELLQMLKDERPRWIEIHHFVGHDPQVLMLPEQLGLPYDIVLHDFASVCPRISMCDDRKTYCGQPAEVRQCENCVEKNGNRLADIIGPAALRNRTSSLVAGARRVVAPTDDTARRFSRYVSAAKLDVRPWEDDVELSTDLSRVRAHRKGDEVRVCVVGAIGEEKGYDVLLACARDAARRKLALSFSVVGHTVDDTKLIDTDRVFVTGYFREDECLSLIKAQNASLGFLPSVWPETWCYALSALWRATLWPVVFDLGGHAERIRRMKKGTVLPLGLAAGRINDKLLGLACGEA